MHVEEFYHSILLLSVTLLHFLFSYVKNICVNGRQIQADAGQCTGGFYYLIVHCSLFSLKKAGGAKKTPKKPCYFFKEHLSSDAEV